MTDAIFGQCLALFSATCFAVAAVCVSRSRQSRGDRGVFFSVLVTMVCSALLWLAAGPEPVSIGGPDWWRGVGWFVVAGVCAMVLGRAFLFESIRRLGVVRASATKRLNPFFSVVAAALVLSERITPLAGIGMAIIATSFGIMVRESLLKGSTDRAGAPALAYAWGAGSAAAYAGAYVTRKLGLTDLPAPAFGTLVSAAAGLVFMLGMATVSTRQRDTVVNVFRYLDRWVVSAALAMSAGQIALFAALLYEKVSVLVMITSLEVFIASFLSVVVFRIEARPGPAIQVAAGLAMLGVVLVATG